jgi:predicted short-subunit dehydrogenase-like oxidoreductase (DUF2520 family)
MNIVLIGAGNVASHLAPELHQAGHAILQVFSQSENHAKSLAKGISAEAIWHLDNITPTADLYIIATPDSTISQIATSFYTVDGIVVHTSGSMNINLLSQLQHHGVFYPFQTFSKHRSISFKEIPILIEGSSPKVEKTLLGLANQLSTKVYQLDSNQRKQLHIAAVFSCNFVNHLYYCAEEILKNTSLPFSILKPLILETAQKINTLTPGEAQTGPASRGDLNTIDSHIELLQKSPENSDLLHLYKELSERILKLHNYSKG